MRLDEAFAFCRVSVCVSLCGVCDGCGCEGWIVRIGIPHTIQRGINYHYNLTASQLRLTTLKEKSTLNPAQQQLVQCLLLE